MNWLLTSDVRFQAAVVAAVVAGCFSIAAILLKDFLAPNIFKSFAADEMSNEVFRRYAEPLAACATTLLWRMRETLAQDGRGFYLAAVEPRSVFENYKLISTYYRLAALLGCIRALQKDLLYFRVRQEKVDAIESALNEFEQTLADGDEVELQRLRGLLKLWDADLRRKEDEKRIAVDIERAKRVWMSKRKEIDYVDLPKKDQDQLLREIIGLMVPYLNTDIPDDVRKATAPQALRFLFIKQAWLYRDWQSSIGDMMTKPAQTGNRSYEVIGFGEFEKIALDPSLDEYRNLERLSCIFDGLEIDREDPFDSRGVILRKIYVATAKLILALSSTDYSKYLISAETLKEVDFILSRPKPH